MSLISNQYLDGGKLSSFLPQAFTRSRVESTHLDTGRASTHHSGAGSETFSDTQGETFKSHRNPFLVRFEGCCLWPSSRVGGY